MSVQKPASPWSYKPWWCQPWSILLTGISSIGGSWMLLKTLWVTVIVAIPVLVWMSFFLLIWPELMRQSGLLEALGALEQGGKGAGGQGGQGGLGGQGRSIP